VATAVGTTVTGREPEAVGPSTTAVRTVTRR